MVSVGVAAGVGWAVRGEDLGYRHALVKYDNEHGEPNRYVNLDDGEAQLSIGSPDGHRIVVQWRDPDGHGWTEPETVWTDEKNLAIDNTVRYGGGTVTVMQIYTTDSGSDSDTDSVTVGIVCHDLECTEREAPGFGGEAQVTPDGRTAYLGQDRKGAHLWTADEGIHLARWSGTRASSTARCPRPSPCSHPTGRCAWSPRGHPAGGAPSSCSRVHLAPQT